MNLENVIEGKNIEKSYKSFKLDIPFLQIPKGLATALIGENGAGKSTLLNILSGIRIDNKGELTYFGKYSADDRENDPYVKEHIGYLGNDNYYLPHWTVGQVKELSKLLFDNFDEKKYDNICSELVIPIEDGKKKVSALSEGNRVKLKMAGLLARDTDVLILDEPASPLDPLMREKLCDIIREYLMEKEGRSVFFSTHNISDMENVTDYAIIMENGSIVEEGMVEDLKEKYILVKGEEKDAEAAKNILYTISVSKYGFEGICLSENLDKLAGMDVVTETPTLSQISVSVMKKNSMMK